MNLTETYMRKLFLLYWSFLTHFCSSVGINYDFLKILGLSKQCILNNFHCPLEQSNLTFNDGYNVMAEQGCRSDAEAWEHIRQAWAI